VTHTIPIFSAPSGIDSAGYEGLGQIIARFWTYNGVHYLTGDELPGVMEHVSLPPNVFALVAYLNGGPSHMGCVAVVAALASFVCLDINLTARLIGAKPNVALAVTALVSVLPSFLYYTSDTYKDGFVAFVVIGVLATSVRLAHRFSVLQVAWALVLLAALWETRYYLVFVMPAPLLLGVMGVRSGSVMRLVLAGLVISAVVIVAYAYSNVAVTATQDAVQTFRGATAQNVLDENAASASGVNLGTGPSSLLPRLAYTLFSPFPWQPGSLGLQLEKLEVFVWYYFLYRTWRAVRHNWRIIGADAIVFVSFLVPVTVAYAFSFSNIGLIVRQRIDIVLATITLATVSWSGAQQLAQASQAAVHGDPRALRGGRRASRGLRPSSGLRPRPRVAP
ncbi:MAG: hypothetical protein JOZ69_05350, partial [Myxococcales bacterium]|nr:hypothetical protein [Myxococcales bacterium]